MDTETPDATWDTITRAVLKRHKVDLVTYVPDNVLRPLIDGVHADPYFTAFAVAREEEGLGIIAGAWVAGRRGILLMQTSGFATLANVLASLPMAFQIPTLMMVSERGTLGEFNTRHAGRIQHRPDPGRAHHAPGARCPGGGALYDDPPR